MSDADDTVVEKRRQSIADSDEAMSRGSVLGPPDCGNSAVLLQSELRDERRNDSTVDLVQVGHAAEVAIPEQRADDGTISVQWFGGWPFGAYCRTLAVVTSPSMAKLASSPTSRLFRNLAGCWSNHRQKSTRLGRSFASKECLISTRYGWNLRSLATIR